MKKLDPSRPVYSQIYDLLSVGEGPWKIQAYTTQYARNAQSVVSQIGYRKGTRYSTSKKGLVLTIKKVVSLPEPVYDLPEAKAEEKSPIHKVLDSAIAERERLIGDLEQDLVVHRNVLDALKAIKNDPPF